MDVTILGLPGAPPDGMHFKLGTEIGQVVVSPYFSMGTVGTHGWNFSRLDGTPFLFGKLPPGVPLDGMSLQMDMDAFPSTKAPTAATNQKRKALAKTLRKEKQEEAEETWTREKGIITKTKKTPMGNRITVDATDRAVTKKKKKESLPAFQMEIEPGVVEEVIEEEYPDAIARMRALAGYPSAGYAFTPMERALAKKKKKNPAKKRMAAEMSPEDAPVRPTKKQRLTEIKELPD